MSYTITARVFQTNPNNFFRIVEKTVFTRGTWSEANGQEVLSMVNSGTSGTLRFAADNGENFIVALGVHNARRWTDIVTNLTAEQTGVLIHPQYYPPSTDTGRQQQRERQLATYNVRNAQGRQFSVNFVVAEGNNLTCNIVIG